MAADSRDSRSPETAQLAMQGGGSNSTDVKVVVRVRPQTLDMELQPGVQTCVTIEGYNVCTVRSPHETVSLPFNWVAGPATTQSEFFKVVGRPTVENCLSGFNSSIFAYGQTGSGKTHTMIGQLPDQQSSSLPADAGIIPRIFRYLWARMPEVAAGLLANTASSTGSMHSSTSSLVSAARGSLTADDASRCAEQPSLKWLVRCSMLEIHKEDVYDLLRPGTGPLNVREDIRKGVYVEGLCERVVEDVCDALAVLHEGTRNRQVAATDMNAASSRSHCIFTCHIESRLEPQAGMVNVRSSRLHLVDLAGSERLKTSWASAAATAAANSGASVSSSWDGGSMGGSNSRLRETTSINSSLTVLGLVILRLTEQQPHIPYRNSKLTFLLQDSIGGNAKTVIVANISPSEACLQETLSTLGFAARARKIVNKAVVNEDNNDDVTLLRQKVKRLHQELALARALAAKATAGLRVSDNSSSVTAKEAAQQAAHEAAAELQELQEQLEHALQLISDLECRNSELEQAREFWLRERNELEQNCLEARQDLEAMKVSLQQAIKENKENKKKPRWLPDMLGKAAQQQPCSTPPAPSPAAHAAEASSTPGSAGRSPLQQQQGSSSSKQQNSPGWSFSSMFGSRKDKSRAAAAAAAATPAASADTTSGAGELEQETQQTGEHSQQLPQAMQDLCPQQHQQQHVLQLVSRQLQELTGTLCPDSCQARQLAHSASSHAGGLGTDAAASAGASQTADAGSGQLQGGDLRLQELQQYYETIPEVQSIVAALRTLAAWQAQQTHVQVQQQAAAAEPAPSKSQPQPSSKVAPSELHRQLFEEREVTAQLQARIRQLQQELLLAGGPAVAATVPLPSSASATPVPAKLTTAAARLARLSPGVGVHYSADAACVRVLQVAPTLTLAPTALEAAFAQVDEGPTADPAAAQDSTCSAAAAAAGEPAAGEQAEHGVLVQVGFAAAADSKADAQQAQPEASHDQQQQEQEQQQAVAAAAAAAATIADQQAVIADLRAQLTELQERFDLTQRERSNFNSKLQSMRSVLAAARCSTPSSLLSSSGLASPQPSFGALEPVFGSSICEEGEEEMEEEEEEEGAEDELGGLRLTESFSCWHPQPEVSSPVRLPQSGSDPSLGAEVSLAAGGSTLDEEMSEAEVWRQHHSQIQQQQVEYERKEQLAKAVHAAIKTGALLGYRTFSPSASTAQHGQHSQQPHQLTSTAGSCDQHTQEQAGPVGFTQDGALHAEQQEQVVAAWVEQQSSEAGSSDSETTRSNGSTRGSSCSCSAADEAEGAQHGWPTAANELHGSGMLPEPAASAQTHSSIDGQEAAVAAEVAAAAAAAAGANEGMQSVLGQDEASERWPAWDASAYEDEIRQLSDQLQGYVTANSQLKALLQQREAELKAQSECLQQQGHELNCCQDFVEELEQRLKEADESAAAAQAEHCDAMWLKGQVEGLRGLNEALQVQLDEMGPELVLRAAQVEELQLLLQRYSQQDSVSSGQQPDADAGPAPPSTAAAAAQAAETAVAATVVAAVPAVDAGTQTADLAGEGADGASAATPGCKSSVQKPQLQLPADDAVPHESGQYDQGCRTPTGSIVLQAASPARTPGSRRGRHRNGPLPGAAVEQGQQPMSPFRQLRVHTHHLRAEPHNAQVATEQRTLLQQQIVAMGLVMQRQQLEQQLDQVRQQLQGLQHEQAGGAAGAGAMLSRLGSPAQHDAAYLGSPQQEQPPQSPARLLLQPRLGQQSRLACSGSSSPQAVLPGAGIAGTAAAVGDPMPIRRQRSVGMLVVGPCAAESAQPSSPQLTPGTDAQAAIPMEAGQSPERRAGSSSSPSRDSSAVSTPRSTSASDSGDSTELLNELNELAMGLQQLACASHQASTFKAVSATTLRCSQTLPAGAAGPGSAAVSGAGSPVSWQGQAVESPGSTAGAGALLQAAAALDADATLKLQADLQVSSAYELAATRGLLHAGAVVQELRSVLTSTKHTGHRTRQAASTCHASAAAAGRLPQIGAAAAGQPAGSTPPRDQQLQRHPGTGQRQREREQSPPVVRTLFSTRESADFSATESLGDAARASSAVPAVVAAAAPGGGSPAQQQDSVSILRQLQQQQQYIIQLLGSLSAMPQPGTVAGGSPSAALPLQQLTDAQQQLQVLLHVAGALMQQAHVEQGGGSDSAADAAQGVLLAPSALGAAGVRNSADLAGSGRQGSGHWSGSAAAAAAGGGAAEHTPGSSPTRQQHKAAGLQELQGSSPDQQQQRDSSPDKLRRSQRARPWSAAAADGDDAVRAAAGQQLALVVGSSSSPAHWQGEQHLQQVSASDQEQPGAGAHAEELAQLRGEVVKLQVQLQEARLQVKSARSLLGSCISVDGSRARSTTPDHAWARQSLDSVSTPAGAAAASGAVTAASTGATVASGSSAGTPASRLVLLNGRNKELQVQCEQREGQIRTLEKEVRRLQVQLQQAAVPAYLGGSAASTAGGLTPRGAATPRHGLAGISVSGLAGPGPSLFSPQRRAVSSPGTSGNTPGRSFGAAAAAYGTPPAMYGAAGAASPGLGGGAFAGTQPAFMPTTRFASGSSHGCIPEVQTWLSHPHVAYTAATAEVRGSTSGQDSQQQSGSGCGQVHSSSTSVRASLDEVSCASSSSRGRARGIKVGSGKPPLHVSSLRRPR